MRQAQTLNRLKNALKPGQVYRRAHLARLSSNVDRHLKMLVKEGYLHKLKQGLYARPETSAYGELPPDEEILVRSFLKDDHFVVYSFNAFNSLGLGTTQLYNRRVVLNRKRHEEVSLGGRSYFFHRWREVPKQVTPEFLVVELLNSLNELAEDRELVLEHLKEKLPTFDAKKLRHATNHYGTYSTQLKMRSLLEEGEHHG